MKKLCLFIFAVMQLAFLNATPPERVSLLTGKILSEDNYWYFTLADGSCFKVVPFLKRTQTWTEWWNGSPVSLLDAYECTPKDFVVGEAIQVYLKEGNIDLDERTAANSKELQECTHLVICRTTGQVLFAAPIRLNFLMQRLIQDAHDRGFAEGFKAGRRSGVAGDVPQYLHGE